MDTVTEWMENEAPSEFGELNMLDTYKYRIKMRAYILEEKYLAMLLRAYRQERQIKDEYLNRLIQLAKENGTLSGLSA